MHSGKPCSTPMAIIWSRRRVRPGIRLCHWRNRAALAFFSDATHHRLCLSIRGNVSAVLPCSLNHKSPVGSNGQLQRLVGTSLQFPLILASHWQRYVLLEALSCWGCAYPCLTKIYSLAHVEHRSQTRMGLSFRAIQTWYDDTNELGAGRSIR